MASDNEASCESDPNFAVICAFIEKFGVNCGLTGIDFNDLQDMLENTQEVAADLIELHVKLLRKARKTVSNEKWERALIKFCHSYSSLDAWEIERFGYKKARLQSKLRVLKELLEMQFDYNIKFKTEINKMSAQELRTQPLGKDRMGRAYWYQCDENCQMKVYKEDLDEETWVLVAKNRESLVSLISELANGEKNPEAIVNDDSNSLIEKPILDTGQNSESTSTSEEIEVKEQFTQQNSEDDKTAVTEESSSDVQPADAEDSSNQETEAEDLKRKADEMELPVPKRPRMYTPNTRRTRRSDDVIEDPVVVVRGEGSGSANKCGNWTESPIVGDEVEEPVRYFYGVGLGVECENGNQTDENGGQSESTEKSDGETSINENSCLNSVSVNSVPKCAPPFKLGTIMDSKTDIRAKAVKNCNRISRWDVGKPVEELLSVETPLLEPQNSLEKDDERIESHKKEEPATKMMFFFGPGCMKFNSPLQTFGESKSNDTEPVHMATVAPEPGENTENDDSTSDSKMSEQEKQSEPAASIKLVEYAESDNEESDEGTNDVNISSEAKNVDLKDSCCVSINSVEDVQNGGNIVAETLEESPSVQPEENSEAKVSDVVEESQANEAVASAQVESPSNLDSIEPVEVTNKFETLQDDTNFESDKGAGEITISDQVKEQPEVVKECVSDKDNVEERVAQLFGDEIDLCVEKQSVEGNCSEVHPVVAEISNEIQLSSIEKTETSSEATEKVQKSDTESKETVPSEENCIESDVVNATESDKRNRESIVSTKNCKENSLEKVLGNIKSSICSSQLEEIPISDNKEQLKVNNLVQETQSEPVVTELSCNNVREINGENESADESPSLSKSEECESMNSNLTKDTPEIDPLQSENVPEAKIIQKESTVLEIDDKDSNLEVRKLNNISEIVEELPKSEEIVENTNNQNISSDCKATNKKQNEEPEQNDSTKITDSSEISAEDEKNSDPCDPKPVLRLRSFSELTATIVHDSEKNSNWDEPKIQTVATCATEILDASNVKCTESVDLDLKSTEVSEETSKNSTIDLNLNAKQLEETIEILSEEEPPKNQNVLATVEEKTKDAPERRVTRASKHKTADVEPTRNSSKKVPKPAAKKEENVIELTTKKEEEIENPGKEEPISSPVKPDSTDVAKIPVDEPICTQKLVPLLTCVSISKLTGKSELEPEPVRKKFPLVEDQPLASNSPQSVISIPDSESNSNGAAFGSEERDPLALEDDDEIKQVPTAPENPFSLSSFSLDFDDTAAQASPPVIITRCTRKRSHEAAENKPETEGSAGKKQKVKAKRAIDVQLRRSVEEQKKMVISSSDEDNGAQMPSPGPVIEIDDEEEGNVAKKSSPVRSVDESTDQPSPKKRRKKRNRLLLGLDLENLPTDDDLVSGVRHSRRIAQIKIREEAERRKLEEIAAVEIVEKTKKKSKQQQAEEKEYKADKRHSEEDDSTAVETDSDSRKKRKRKRKHKDPRKIFDESNPWRSSSGSSSSNEDEDDEEIAEEEEEETPLFKSDHEFSPESDLEDNAEAQPMKRARTARKESDVEEDADDDHACQKCNKTDHPEWILLCDGCDNGWHCSCLRPALLVIPEGDWYCPPCQHASLIKKLQKTLAEYDKKNNKRKIEVRRKERLAYVGISLNNVLPPREEHNKHKHEERKKSDGSESDGSDSGSYASSGSTDSDSEPIYQLRARRQAHSYRFNDYDELINSAIQDEMEAVKGAGNQGRGKDISTIVNAEQEEGEEKIEEQPEEEALPPVVPEETDVKEYIEPKDVYSDDDPIKPPRKLKGRKKPRKLNSLDISSGDDQDSDEDFKGSSTSEEEEEDLDEEYMSESSGGRRRGRGGGGVRRSTRARTARYDREFINDDSDDDAPRRKKTRSIWDESEESEEESDGSWVRKKKRKGGNSRSNRKPPAFPARRKPKKKKNEDSDPEMYKKKKPKVKYGRMTSDDENIGIRTRGKKINYLDVLGSDSDEEVQKKPSRVIESEDEYVVNEDELEQEEELEVENEKNSEEEENESESDDVAAAVPKLTIRAEADKKKPEVNKTVVGLKNIVAQATEDDEPNPIEEINKNMEEMDDKEMEKFMEEEEYANKQLQLVALQIEKEKKRREREAKKLEILTQQQQQVDEKTCKKPGRKQTSPFFSPVPDVEANVLMNSESTENDELSEPPGVTLPSLFNDMPFMGANADGTPKKRRGRGKGKKTLAAEQAKAEAEARSKGDDVPAAAVAAVAPGVGDAPMHLSIAPPPQPFSQSQPTPSVITRMLQAQPAHHGYPAAHAPPPHAYPRAEVPVAYSQNAPRVPVPSLYRQGPPPMNYPMMRGPPPPPGHLPPPHVRDAGPHNLTTQPHLYHSHRPLDPSPSGGGLNLSADRNSPSLGPPPADSPLSGKGGTPPPPASAYARPPIGRLITGATTVPSMRHLPMMPAHMPQPRTNSVPPFHHGMPPNYYGAYPPPPPIHGEENAVPPPAYQSPYPDECISTADGNALAAPSEGSNSKSYEEEAGGEFGGLVSYFSSQREDDLDT